MTDRRDAHEPNRPDAVDDQNSSTAMTIAIDPELAPLATELQRQIHAEATSLTPRRPPIDQLLQAPRRVAPSAGANRFHLVAAAAAVLLVLVGVLVLRAGRDSAEVKMGGEVVPVVAWHAAVDPSTGFLLSGAYDNQTLTAGPSGTTLQRDESMEPAVAIISVAYQGDTAGTALQPPWMLVTVMAHAEGDSSFTMSGMGTPITVGSFDGSRFAGTGSSGQFGFVADSRHDVNVKWWGVEEPDAVAAASTLRIIDGGPRFEVAAPPAGLHAKASPLAMSGFDHASYLRPWADGSGRSAHLDLEVRHVNEGGPDVAIDVIIGQAMSTPLDLVDIQTISYGGGTALLRMSGDTALVSWADEAHERVGIMRLSGPVGGSWSVAEVRSILDGLRTVDDATWQDMVHRCPEFHGTVPTTAVGSC